MKKITVDAKGLACPKPVIMTKKTVEQIPLEEKPQTVIEVIVDNETARKNIQKLAQSLGYKADVSKTEGALIYMDMTLSGKGVNTMPQEQEGAQKQVESMFSSGDVYLFASESFGENVELGRTLMKSLLYTISEGDHYPEAMIFLNSGVKITTSDIPGLEKLEKAGVKILSCGACLNYFELEGQLKYGQVSNMYEIYSTIQGAKKFVKLS